MKVVPDKELCIRMRFFRCRERLRLYFRKLNAAKELIRMYINCIEDPEYFFKEDGCKGRLFYDMLVKVFTEQERRELFCKES